MATPSGDLMHLHHQMGMLLHVVTSDSLMLLVGRQPPASYYVVCGGDSAIWADCPDMAEAALIYQLCNSMLS